MTTQLPNQTPLLENESSKLSSFSYFLNGIQMGFSYLKNLSQIISSLMPMPIFELTDQVEIFLQGRCTPIEAGNVLEESKRVASSRKRALPLEGKGKASQSQLKSSKEKVDRAGQKALKEPWWLVTGRSSEFISFANDIPSTYITVQSFVNKLRKKPMQRGLYGLGIASGGSILTGYIGGCRGYVDNEKASKINDFWGKVYAKIRMIRGGLETIGSLLATPISGLGLIGTKTSAKVFAKASLILGGLGSTCFGVGCLLLAIPCSISMVNGIRFRQDLNLAMSHSEKETEAKVLLSGMKFLMSQLELNGDEKKEVACLVLETKEIWDGEDVKEIEIDSEEEKMLTPSDRGYARGFVFSRFKDKTFDLKVLSQLEKHVCLGLIHAKKTKGAELSRKAGGETLSLIQKEKAKLSKNQLINRLVNPDDREAIKEAQRFTKEVEKNTSSHIWFNVATVSFCVLGALAFFAGMVSSGGVLGIVLLVAWMVISFGMLGMDGHALWKAYQSGDPEFKDKLMMGIMSVFMTSAVVLGIVFSGGLAPLIASAVIGVIWIGLTGYCVLKKSPKAHHDRSIELNQVPSLSLKTKAHLPASGA